MEQTHLDRNREIESFIESISKERNLKVLDIGAKSGDYHIPNNIFPSVEQWLAGFRDAEFVLTDSFHACVFAMLFHKPFIVIGNKERGMTRFESFLGQFGLTDRMVSDYKLGNISYEIDYTHADQHLEELRNKALTYLQSI